jgi:TldD protein
MDRGLDTMTPSRRDFLKQVSAATAFGMLHQIPGRELWGVSPADLIPEPDEALLRELALVAIDAARSAGAEFADVRVSGSQGGASTGLIGFDRSQGMRPMQLRAPSVGFHTDYGIRVIVDDAWGFAGDHALTPDSVGEAARRAVARARANRPRQMRALDLAPVERVEDGRWEPPIEEDPFTMPVRDHYELLLDALAAAEGVRGVIKGQIGMGWNRWLRVFASSEGSLIVQRLTQGGFGGEASGRSQDDHQIVDERIESGGWYGYEVVRRADLVVALRDAAERTVAKSQPAVPAPPQVSVDVGRYDLVLGGGLVASLIRSTLAPALNLERALGYHANREGTSFAAPPAEMLDKYQVASPLITVRADRTRPHSAAAVGWDDEGVPAGEHTLIEGGVIVDYLTSRQTAMELASLYQARGEAVRSRGCTVARWDESGGEEGYQGPPRVSVPNITLDPGPEDVTVEDLIADTKRGYYVPRAPSGSSDQQLLSGQFMGRDGEVREIRDGKLGRPMKDFAFQFLTPQLWKSIDALGGARTIADVGNFRAVAARVREVNVLNSGITL